jgi:hypothetical protein
MSTVLLTCAGGSLTLPAMSLRDRADGGHLFYQRSADRQAVMPSGSEGSAVVVAQKAGPSPWLGTTSDP